MDHRNTAEDADPMIAVGLLIAALVLWVLFRRSQRRRWSARGRKNRPLRRFPSVCSKDSDVSSLREQKEAEYPDVLGQIRGDIGGRSQR